MTAGGARSPWARPLACAALLAVLAGPTRTARAWDPATTHLGLTDRAALRAAIHGRWMEASGGTLGLFSPLRVDPARLAPAVRRLLLRAVEAAPEDAGARPRGGPGACPAPPAPPGTRDRCVEGDLWEASALGWLRLGVVAEAVPTERLLGHFFDPADWAARRWQDPHVPAAVARARHTRANGATIASFVTRSTAGRGGPTALAHLSDPKNPLGTAALARHLAALARAETPEDREHHLALALLCAGAIAHVVQDATVPAHARADLAAFFAPLSQVPGDRGLALAAYTALLYGRTDLPDPVALAPRDADAGAPPEVRRLGAALDRGLEALLVGTAKAPGLARFAASRFLSEAPASSPRRLRATDPVAAAAELLDGLHLAPEVTRGAVLDRWPAADRGYLRTRTGRALAAWRRTADGRVALYGTRLVYRDQAGHLLPLAEAATRALLEAVFAAPPTVRWDGRRLTVTGPGVVEGQTVVVAADGKDGRRRTLATATVGPGGAVTLRPSKRPDRVVVSGFHNGIPRYAEVRLAAAPNTTPPAPAGNSEVLAPKIPSQAPAANGEAPPAAPQTSDEPTAGAPDATGEAAPAAPPTSDEPTTGAPDATGVGGDTGPPGREDAGPRREPIPR